MVQCASCWPAARFAGLVLATFLLAGCSAKHYRRAADKEVYGILQAYEQQVLGETNAFTVNTRYSDRAPKDIPPSEIISDRTATNRRVINLEEALRLAVLHSREYQTEKERLYLEALSLTGARYEFTPQFIANSTAQVEGFESTVTQTKNGEPRRVDTHTLRGSVGSQVGVSQLLKTGGQLSLALGNDLVRYFTGKPDGVARNSAINILSVNLSQPLLAGFGINNPLVEALTQAERDVVYAIRTFSVYQEQFAVDTVNSYFDLLTLKDIVRNNYRNYTNRVEFTVYLDARSVDRERKSNVDDARTAELSARTSYINSLASYMTQLDAFKIRLGLPIAEDLFLDDRDLDNLIQAGLPQVNLSREAAFKLALQNQLEILNAIDRFEDSKRKVRVAADQLRAELGLFSNASLSSEGPDDYSNFDPDKIRYTAGVRLNLPIDRLRQRNTYRATLISFESQIRSLGLVLDNYKNRIDRGLRTIEQARLNYLNGLESLNVAKRRVENNSMLLEAGRATPRDLREAQDSLIDAENTLSVLYAAYLNARLGLMVNIGVIEIEPASFWLQDPLKERLTPELRGEPPLRMPDNQVLPPELFLEPQT